MEKFLDADKVLPCLLGRYSRPDPITMVEPPGKAGGIVPERFFRDAVGIEMEGNPFGTFIGSAVTGLRNRDRVVARHRVAAA